MATHSSSFSQEKDDFHFTGTEPIEDVQSNRYQYPENILVDFLLTPSSEIKAVRLDSVLTPDEINNQSFSRLVEGFNFYKKNIESISKIFRIQLSEELEEKQEFIEGFEEYYRSIAFHVILPTIISFNPISIDIRITVDNTLFITSSFDNEIKIELESFICNIKDGKKIRTAYTISDNQEDLITRLCDMENTSKYINKDLSSFYEENTQDIELISITQ